MFSFEVTWLNALLLSSSIVSVLGLCLAEIGICVSRSAKACWVTDRPPAERKWDPTAGWIRSHRSLPSAPTPLSSGKFVVVFYSLHVFPAFGLTGREHKLFSYSSAVRLDVNLLCWEKDPTWGSPFVLWSNSSIFSLVKACPHLLRHTAILANTNFRFDFYFCAKKRCVCSKYSHVKTGPVTDNWIQSMSEYKAANIKSKTFP